MSDINDSGNLLDGEFSLDNLEAMLESGLSDDIDASIEDEIQNSLSDIDNNVDDTLTDDLNDLTGDDTNDYDNTDVDVDNDNTDDDTNSSSDDSQESVIDTNSGTDTNTDDNVYFNRTKSLIELGLLDDVRVATSSDDTEGTPLSEFKDISEDQLKKVIELQQEKKNKSLETDYVSRSEFSENQLQIIDMMKNGGDLKEIFNSAQEMRRPFEGMDLEDETTQKKIILHHFMTNQKLSQKEAYALLAQKEKDFEVDDFSKQIVNAYNSSYDNYMNNKAEELRLKKEEDKKRVAETRKSLSKVLKENKFKDSLSRKIVDGVTKPVEDNKFQVHKALEAILENPQEHYEVLLHLLDKEAFSKLYKTRQKQQETNSIINLIDAVPKDRSKKIAKDKKDDVATEFEREILNIDLSN